MLEHPDTAHDRPPGDQVLFGLEPLDDAALDLVVGGRPKDTLYLCTVTSADVSEDCWKE